MRFLCKLLALLPTEDSYEQSIFMCCVSEDSQNNMNSSKDDLPCSFLLEHKSLDQVLMNDS